MTIDSTEDSENEECKSKEIKKKAVKSTDDATEKRTPKKTAKNIPSEQADDAKFAARSPLWPNTPVDNKKRTSKKEQLTSPVESNIVKTPRWLLFIINGNHSRFIVPLFSGR